MTTFLTFSVYSLRVSGDIPIQSEYVPLITLYFLFSTVFTLVAFLWFLLANHFKERSTMPNVLLNLTDFILRKADHLKSKAIDKTLKIKPDLKPTDNETNETDYNLEKNHDENNSKSKIFIKSKMFLLPSKLEIDAQNKDVRVSLENDDDSNHDHKLVTCVKCSLCKNCKLDSERHLHEKIHRERIEKSIALLNNLASLLMLLFIILSLTLIWAFIAN